MKIVKTWLNAWITSNRIKGANSVYPCLFGCDACVDRLSHYLICPKMMSTCKFLDRNCPHHTISRLGIDNPDKGVLIHMCCVYSGYHAVISHVKMNHDTFATECQRLQLSIRSAQKTWSVFAEAYDAEALDFGQAFAPNSQTLFGRMLDRFPWRNTNFLTFFGSPDMHTELSAQSSEGLDLDQDPLVLVPIPHGLDRVLPNGGSAVPGGDNMT